MSEQEKANANQPESTAHFDKSKRILIAEDEDVNRWLATRLLEHKGYQVTTLTNGRAVLAAVAQESYALILLDTHLPLLSGMETTQQIRQREKGTGTRVPIIAFTVEQDASPQCWQAGLDSYLTKPIHTEEFYRTLEAVWALQSRSAQEITALPVFDHAEALARMNWNVELLQRTAEIFFGSALHLLTAMRRALVKQDFYNLDFAAHRLKGAARNLSATVVSELAGRLELLATTRNLLAAQTTITTLEKELAHLQATIEAALWIKSPGTTYQFSPPTPPHQAPHQG